MVSDPARYPYSSFPFYASSIPSSLLTPDPLYPTFGDTEEVRRTNYREFVLARLEDYESFERHTLTQRALGSEAFLQSLETNFKILISRRPRGRPQKEKREMEAVQ
ncbi:MAG: hypothetical protein HYU34_03875 [Candidatus Omnitrophica bacterium]|nr:hypothetical protein [Candidatus Omnitrophota bacterium]